MNFSQFLSLVAKRLCIQFFSKLKFKVKIIPHKGDDSWLDKTVKEIYQVLNSEEIPEPVQIVNTVGMLKKLIYRTCY